MHKIIIINDGMEDSNILSSDAYSYTWIDRVSKLKGLKINVAESSLTTSIKIKIEENIMLVDIIGIWTLKSVSKGFFPSIFEV